MTEILVSVSDDSHDGDLIALKRTGRYGQQFLHCLPNEYLTELREFCACRSFKNAKLIVKAMQIDWKIFGLSLVFVVFLMRFLKRLVEKLLVLNASRIFGGCIRLFFTMGPGTKEVQRREG